MTMFFESITGSKRFITPLTMQDQIKERNKTWLILKRIKLDYTV